MEDKSYSLTTAMLDYFGKHPGQSTAEFAQELKALTDADKAEFRAALIKLGYRITIAPTALWSSQTGIARPWG